MKEYASDIRETSKLKGYYQYEYCSFQTFVILFHNYISILPLELLYDSSL